MLESRTSALLVYIEGGAIWADRTIGNDKVSRAWTAMAKWLGWIAASLQLEWCFSEVILLFKDYCSVPDRRLSMCISSWTQHFWFWEILKVWLCFSDVSRKRSMYILISQFIKVCSVLQERKETSGQCIVNVGISVAEELYVFGTWIRATRWSWLGRSYGF